MYNLNLINNSTYSKYITEVINRLHVKLEESCAVFTHYDSLYSYITSSILNRNLHHDDCKSLIIETLSAYKQNHEVTWSDIYTVSEYTWYIKSYMNDLEDELN